MDPTRNQRSGNGGEFGLCSQDRLRMSRRVVVAEGIKTMSEKWACLMEMRSTLTGVAQEKTTVFK